MLESSNGNKAAIDGLDYVTGLILGFRPTNERQRYFVTTPLIDNDNDNDNE